MATPAMRSGRQHRIVGTAACSLWIAPWAILLASHPTPEFASQPIGWASIDGGTTGGGNLTPTVIRDAATFLQHIKGDSPAVLHIAGEIRLDSMARVGSHKTLLGVSPQAVIRGGGLHLRDVRNVIVRNLTILESTDDAINIEDGTHHVWIDHCELSNCRDGLLDVKRGADLITVSWNWFHDHGKTSLIGHSDKPAVLAGDKGKLRVTYHHNFFDGTKTRHPRVRAAEGVHLFNNYFRGNEYGIASTMDAGVLVEANYFERVVQPTHTLYGESDEPGRLVERDNVYAASGKPQTRGEVLEPKLSYAYTPSDARTIPQLITKSAGVRLSAP